MDSRREDVLGALVIEDYEEAEEDEEDEEDEEKGNKGMEETGFL